MNKLSLLMLASCMASTTFPHWLDELHQQMREDFERMHVWHRKLWHEADQAFATQRDATKSAALSLSFKINETPTTVELAFKDINFADDFKKEAIKFQQFRGAAKVEVPLKHGSLVLKLYPQAIEYVATQQVLHAEEKDERKEQSAFVGSSAGAQTVSRIDLGKKPKFEFSRNGKMFKVILAKMQPEQTPEVRDVDVEDLDAKEK